MKMIARIISLALVLGCTQQVAAQFHADLEAGLIPGTNYNDVRIPGTSGTLVDISDQLEAQPKIFYRVRAGYTIAKRHRISLLYAPLTVKYKGTFQQPVNFNNTVFPANEDLVADYKFNSYRLTYRYNFIMNTRWTVGAGLTGKIRDADIRFRNDSRDTHYDNVGFVPLVNFYVGYKPSEKWTAILEGDALASKFGRAEDIFAGVSYNVNENFGVKLGYRVVEGGADNDKIYNFTWINYASVGVLLSF